MIFEIEGRCPLCGKVMQDWSRNLICDGKRFNFPFRFYYCDRHGVYVWRGSQHELFDLSKRINQTTNIEGLEPEVIQRFTESDSRMPTLSDYKPVKMKCSSCNGGPKRNGEWKQHYGYLTQAIKDFVYCPWCSTKMPKEKALNS